ncbi:MAG: bifunctional ornithine acetyltransferase/N-acetylglutamate synthase [Eubacteriales bacterium]
MSADVLNSFNMVNVDGDTSTNDMVTVLANGMAGNAEIWRGARITARFAPRFQQSHSIWAALSQRTAKAQPSVICKLTGAADRAALAN